MNAKDIRTLRLQNQFLVSPGPGTPAQVVEAMGVMQAQDYHMAKWALGLRTAGSNINTIQDALDSGKILRTHVLRPTWHFVSAKDIHWMLALSKPQILTSMRTRKKQLGLSDPLIAKTNKILTNVLTREGALPRNVLMEHLQKARIRTDENRMSHLLVYAELEGVICSGPDHGRKQTYALLEARAPVHTGLKKDEALFRLASTYFKSHGPATLEDFIWWSGLRITEAKQAYESVRKNFHEETIGGQTYLFAGEIRTIKQSTFLLPSYDEFMISYKDRSASLPPDLAADTISSNGIFRPIIVKNGTVIGLWMRTRTPKGVQFDINFFEPASKTMVREVEKRKAQYLEFFGETEYKTS